MDDNCEVNSEVSDIEVEEGMMSMMILSWNRLKEMPTSGWKHFLKGIRTMKQSLKGSKTNGHGKILQLV